MKKHNFIFGLTDLAENLWYLLSSEGISLDGFIVDKEYKTIDTKFGLPVYEYETIEEFFPREEIGIYLCIGYSGMNEHRKVKYYDIQSKGYALNSYIHKSALVEATEVGEGNIIFEQAYIGMFSKLGNGNIFYTKAMVAHHSNVGNFNFFGISSSVAGHVGIGNQNFFGNNSFTKEKISIGDKNLIGAGAYVYKDTTQEKVVVAAKGNILEGKTGTDFL